MNILAYIPPNLSTLGQDTSESQRDSWSDFPPMGKPHPPVPELGVTGIVIISLVLIIFWRIRRK